MTVHNCRGRVTFDYHALDGKAIKLRPQRLGLLFLGLSNDCREQVPVSQFAAVLRHSGGMALRCQDVRRHDLRMEMARQCRSLMNHTQ